MMTSSGAPASRRDGEDDEDRKPVIKPGVHLTLTVQDLKGRKLERTVRRTEKLQGLMDAYYASAPDVAYGTGKFLHEGKQMVGWQTPVDLKMEDEDEIDFFSDLMGGRRAGACGPPALVAA